MKGGRLLLNGKRLNLRGASIHEDDKDEGGALSQNTRRLLVNRLRNLGATVTRSHYPLHPAFLEMFDRLGILYWVDAPVYQVPNTIFGRVLPAAERAALLTVRNNMNHASILTWALANEPAGNRSELGIFSSPLQTYIRDASTAVREMDDTHLIGIDRQSRIGEPLTDPSFRYLDVLGVNEYFGWYDSYKADLVRPASTAVGAPRLPRRSARGEPRAAARDHRVRRRGVPLGAGGAAGDLRVPAQVRRRSHRRARLEALRLRLDPLGAARLPRRPDLAGRRARRVGHAAVAQQEPDRGDERAASRPSARPRSCGGRRARCASAGACIHYPARP